MPPQADVLERALDEQAGRWKSGRPIAVEEMLSNLEVDDDSAVDLIYNEFLLREELGERPEPAEYLRRFPKFVEALSRQFEVHVADDGESATINDSEPSAVASAWVPPRVSGYEVEAELGRGGMGVVYRAKQITLNRTVALKMVLPGLGDPVRFRAEAETVARLAHPNIVPIYEIGESGGVPYFSLEFVDGGTLAERIARTPQPPTAAAEMIATLAGAVEAAHRAGVVHRDLKPANILLTREGMPKIADFGLAVQMDSQVRRTRTGAMVGTPAYMAPEQAEGKAGTIGPATDVYALGAILYEMLVGRPPFLGAGALETIWQAAHQDPVPPQRLNPAVPRDLSTVCLHCLAKQPTKRYATAQELADDLRRFLRGEPIRARPAGVLERIGKWARRRPALAALSATLSAALIGGVALVMWTNRELARGNEELAAAGVRLQAALDTSEANFDRASRAVDEIQSLGENELADIPGFDEIRRSLLERVLRFRREQMEQKSTDPATRLRSARSAIAAGNLELQLGRPLQAEPTLRRGIELAEELVAADRTDRSALRAAAAGWDALGWMLRAAGRSADAETAHTRGIELLQPLAGNDPDLRHDLVGAMLGKATALSQTGRRAEATAMLRRAIELESALVADHPPRGDFRRRLGALWNNLAVTLVGPEEETALAHATELFDKLAAQPGAGRDDRERAAVASGNLANRLERAGRRKDAEKHLRRSVDLLEGLTRQYPASVTYRVRLGHHLDNLGLALWYDGRPAEADERFEAARIIKEKLHADQPDLPDRAVALAINLQYRCGRRRELKDLDEALRLIDRAIVLLLQARHSDPDNAAFVTFQRNNHFNRAQVLADRKDHAGLMGSAFDLADLRQADPMELWIAGLFAGRALEIALADTSLSDEARAATADVYACRATALIQRAVDRGFRDGLAFAHATELNALRERPEFRNLLPEWERVGALQPPAGP